MTTPSGNYLIMKLEGRDSEKDRVRSRSRRRKGIKETYGEEIEGVRKRE